MDELELLKKDWKKNDGQFKQVSEQEIYSMLHKSSSSSVKWILIVSILEFIILNGLSVITNDELSNKFAQLHPYLSIFEKVNYAIIIGFIFIFYKNYKSISVLNSSKTLLKQILKTRKIVNIYIIWNILIGSYFGVISAIDGFKEMGKNSSIPQIDTSKLVVIIAITMLLVIPFLWFFYRLLYGKLLNRLKKNLNDLKKMEY
ncbi:hypothetical protein RF683_07230 [Flavobacterium sp. 20NA77.7]|uniref:RDD family protein n=1 Tax=Flavobacterium nakdongensis TaxID=3073563 RepID=A0ABY9R7R0_9FLAO|nr:hypothetical protein [Flavobacterium sp. 20NA77.7]WMW77282.1 hypothetical protein RF683_07230 [Flavobacterium sp. 20NA77.7]